MKYVFLVALAVALASDVIAQKQGICGKVTWVEGNQMPGPGVKRTEGTGIVREIYVYELTTRNEATQGNGLYKEVSSTLVAKGKSNKRGEYRIKLPPGTYSVFTKEPDGLFANVFDAKGSINPVTVRSDDFTILNIVINYKAAY